MLFSTICLAVFNGSSKFGRKIVVKMLQNKGMLKQTIYLSAPISKKETSTLMYCAQPQHGLATVNPSLSVTLPKGVSGLTSLRGGLYGHF